MSHTSSKFFAALAILLPLGFPCAAQTLSPSIIVTPPAGSTTSGTVTAITAGTGITLTTSPCIATCTISVTNPSPGTSVSGDLLTFSNATGALQDSGTLLSSLATTTALASYLPLAGGTMAGPITGIGGSTSTTMYNFGTANTGIYGSSTSFGLSIAGTLTLGAVANSVSINANATFATFALSDNNSASPATGLLSIFAAQGYNNAGTPLQKSFGLIEGSANAITSGAELGQWQFLCEGCGGTAGTSAAGLTIAGVATTPTAKLGAGMTLTVPQLVSCTTVTTSAAGLFSCTVSDARVKNDLGIVVGATDDMPALHRFTFKVSGCGTYGKDACGPAGIHYGWFAQDVQKMYPDLVHRGGKSPLTPDGILQFDKGELVVLIAAKQDSEFAALKSEFARLEHRH